jgi:2-keto-3-deoxy-L-rhamnonate aldolase RhmA
MRGNTLKQRLLAGDSVFGTFVSIPDPAIVELIGYAGYDFVIIDMEHSPIDFDDLRYLLAAADGAGVTPLVRVGTHHANPILRVLDSGALGVVAPHVRNDDHARALVSACRYPPQGARGVSGASRAAAYGAVDFVEHTQRSNREILTVALVEDPEGVEAIEDIVGVPGLDVIWPGPGDLSAALGVPGQSQHPRVQARVERIAEAVRARPELVLAYHIMDPGQLDHCRKLGARFIVYSQDSRVLLHAYRHAVTEMRQ